MIFRAYGEIVLARDGDFSIHFRSGLRICEWGDGVITSVFLSWWTLLGVIKARLFPMSCSGAI